MRDVAYLSSRTFTSIVLQRRRVSQYEDHKKNSWKALCADHRSGYGPGSDLKIVLFTVGVTLGYDNEFSWEQTQMTPTHQGWISHAFLYRA